MPYRRTIYCTFAQTAAAFIQLNLENPDQLIADMSYHGFIKARALPELMAIVI